MSNVSVRESERARARGQKLYEKTNVSGNLTLGKHIFKV